MHSHLFHSVFNPRIVSLYFNFKVYWLEHLDTFIDLKYIIDNPTALNVVNAFLQQSILLLCFFIIDHPLSYFAEIVSVSLLFSEW